MRSNDLFERITRQIADAIAAGAGTCSMPWHRWTEGLAEPVNAITGRPYRGVNTILLWAAAEHAGYSSGRWATYRQWSEAGAQVRKGEKSTSILFWKPAHAGDRDHEDDDYGGPDDRHHRSFIAKVYCVFNAEQVDGAPQAPLPTPLSDDERLAAAESFFANVGATVHHQGDRAFYRPSTDEIHMPRFEQFRDGPAYYSTLGHEHIHWTGAKHRLDRDLKNRFGSEAYAFEELIAELGAAFLAARLGLSVAPRPDHAAYIAGWLKVLGQDPRAILTASSKAQQALDYLETLQPAEGDGVIPQAVNHAATNATRVSDVAHA